MSDLEQQKIVLAAILCIQKVSNQLGPYILSNPELGKILDLDDAINFLELLWPVPERRDLYVLNIKTTGLSINRKFPLADEVIKEFIESNDIVYFDRLFEDDK